MRLIVCDVTLGEVSASVVVVPYDVVLPYSSMDEDASLVVYVIVTFVFVIFEAVVAVMTGAVVSMVNEVIVSGVEAFSAVSVTVIVQFVYVPSVRVARVMVLLPRVADVVALVHEPPYDIVPASSVVNV